ncbi:Voltage-dependent channel, four helix bundle domain [Phytophthora cactorum]|nr:Voltage-dependent channel, four helix bundle domain [Phytophthora cactorum]
MLPMASVKSCGVQVPQEQERSRFYRVSVQDDSSVFIKQSEMPFSIFGSGRNSFFARPRWAESLTTTCVNGISCYGSTSGTIETSSVPSVLRHLSGRIKRGFAVAPTASGGSLEKDASRSPPTIKPPATHTPEHSEKPLQVDLKRRLGFVEPPKRFGADYFIFRFLPREHKLRRWCVQIVTHKYFDRFIIAAIVANSIILGLSDFSVVDSELNPSSSGKKYQDGILVDAYSFQNHIVEFSELPFTIIFTAECILKIIAMGVHGRGSYGKDMWNVLDFFVVVSSLVASLPGMPNVSAIRTIRVLRPLRSLSVIPGMRRLIAALLKALPALGNVVILQIFVFFIFGILGIQLFGGSMNRRCRLTSFPEYIEQLKANEEAYFCIDAPLLDYEDSAGDYTKETSPWNTPQNCFWPVDEDDEFLCAAKAKQGITRVILKNLWFRLRRIWKS